MPFHSSSLTVKRWKLRVFVPSMVFADVVPRFATSGHRIATCAMALPRTWTANAQRWKHNQQRALCSPTDRNSTRSADERPQCKPSTYLSSKNIQHARTTSHWHWLVTYREQGWIRHWNTEPSPRGKMRRGYEKIRPYSRSSSQPASLVLPGRVRIAY